MRGAHEAGAGHAERMAERDGAAIGIDVGGIVGEAEIGQHRAGLGGEGLVQLDHIHLRRGRGRGFSSTLRVAGAGPMPMMRGGTPAVAMPSDAGTRGQAIASSPPASEAMQQGGGAVIDARGIAGGHRAGGLHHALEAGEVFQLGVGAHVLVALEQLRDRPCFCGTADRRRSRRKSGRRPRLRRPGAGFPKRRRPGARGRSAKSSATFSAVSGMESTPVEGLHLPH